MTFGFAQCGAVGEPAGGSVGETGSSRCVSVRPAIQAVSLELKFGEVCPLK